VTVKKLSAYVIWFDVVCTFCGDWLMSLRLEARLDVTQRCNRCGGLPGFNGDSHRTIKPLDLANADLRLRRGRPPKWVVAERAARGLPARAAH
jgi:hypothetical protein